MIFDMKRVDDIRAEFYNIYKHGKFVKNKNKTGSKTIEIIGANFIADDDVIFGNIDEDWSARELSWYKSLSLNIRDIPGKIPKTWQTVSSFNGEINSNYGWCVYSPDNHSQFECCVSTLVEDPSSRQAIMIYTRPSMHSDSRRDGMADFMCTNTVQYFIRDHRLITIVSMRSNDAVFGYKGDLFWQKHVRDELLTRLRNLDKDLIAGDIIWSVGSLHVYEKHFKLVDEYGR